jgi:hypothetical protein
MKKLNYILILAMLLCITFPLLHLIGTQAIIDLSAWIPGTGYIIMSIDFFRRKENKIINYLLGVSLLIASAFAILPLLFYFLNSITSIININYNDILFNYYKSVLNSLIGFTLFTTVYIIDSFLNHKTLVDEKEKKNNRILLTICLTILVITLIVIIRKIGYHISYTRVLIKLTVFLSLVALIPYLIYSGLSKNKLILSLTLMLILTFVNSVQVKYLLSTDISGTKWLAYTNPVRKAANENIDTLQTIKSFHRIGDNFYEMTFNGNYTNILESNNRKCLEESIDTKRFCSLFTTFGDSTHYLFARNFDNPQGWKCKTLVCRTNPTEGYSSLSLVRLADLGFDVSEDLENFSYEKKKALINSVFYVPDGINEKGVVVAMAAVDNRKLNEDRKKPYINCSYLIREILDHAKNIEEAMSLIKKYNIMNDVWSGSFDQHLLIADASGRSVIAEIDNGEFQFIPNITNWQATTNSPSFNVPFEEQKTNCSRYNIISSVMETCKGRADVSKSMDILKKIGHQYTEWSAVYDISQREMNVIIDFDFSKKYKFSLKNSLN